MRSLVDLNGAELDNDTFTQLLLSIANDASAAIMDIYNAKLSVEVEYKEDKSPITKADVTAHNIITKALLNNYPSVLIVSEEGSPEQNKKAIQSDQFWLVDPIDGTKEFISRTGQFTVCIALIQGGKPVFGVVAAPALGVTYYGGPQCGAFKIDSKGLVSVLHTSIKPTNVVFGSHSRPNQETAQYIAENYGACTIKEVGSQLKFVMIADGQADAYPRLSTTMKLWDIAAGQVILEAAGGSLARPDGSPIDYSRPDFLAGDFVAKSNAVRL